MTVFLVDGAIVAEHDRRMGLNPLSFFKGKKPADCFVAVGQIKGRRLKAHKGDGIITCWWCGRLLDNSLSRIRGVGPICIGEYGPMPGRDHIEDSLAYLYEFYRSQCKSQKKRPLGIKRWISELPDDEFKRYWKQYVEEVDPEGQASYMAPAPRHVSRPAAAPVQKTLHEMAVSSHPELVEVV